MSSSAAPSTPEELPSSLDSCVFINCPYDPEFQARFDALVFTVVASGLSPRSALEDRDVSTPRIARILNATFTSKYSIHDLSRCRGEGDANLARFNMPLELGMAMAKRHADSLVGGPPEDQHHWLALVPGDARYAQYASDLSGYDLERYDGSTEDIISAPMVWMANRSPVKIPVTPRKVIEAFPRFADELAGLRTDWRNREPWREILLCAKRNSASLI